MPPKGKRCKQGKGKAVPPLIPISVQPEPPAPEETYASYSSENKKRRKTVTTFSEKQKEEIIDFLMRNEVLYSKRLSGFKDVLQKDNIWATQAAKMESTVEQLKVWYTSMRTMMGRLKKRAKKSGSGGEAVTDMNGTEKWVWDKFSFLIPHIESVDARNVASFAAATASTSGTDVAPSTYQPSVLASTTSNASKPTTSTESPLISQTTSQAGSDGPRRSSEDRMTSGELKELLVDFMSRSTAACGSSYFGKYVEEILSKLPGQIRRDAGANIVQELHRAQRDAEHSKTQPPPSQDQQAPTQFQQQCPQATWQPQPSQWPSRPIGPQPSIWASQDRSYVQRQFPTISPKTSQPQLGPSFPRLIGPITPDVGKFNLSPQLNTPVLFAKDDDTDLNQDQEDPLVDQ